MPTFNGRRLVPPAPRGIPVATTLVDLSSDNSRWEGEQEEDEERDLEATPEGLGETSPLRKADILRTMPDDDAEADALLEREEPPVAGGSSRPEASPQRRPPAEVPTRGRSALISRVDASTPTLPGAASGPPATPPSAPGARAPAPQAARLSGFKLSKRRD
nr:cell division protein ZipA-like [Aegilops tauschii subsp. strangulata]